MQQINTVLHSTLLIYNVMLGLWHWINSFSKMHEKVIYLFNGEERQYCPILTVYSKLCFSRMLLTNLWKYEFVNNVMRGWGRGISPSSPSSTPNTWITHTYWELHIELRTGYYIWYDIMMITLRNYSIFNNKEVVNFIKVSIYEQSSQST